MDEAFSFLQLGWLNAIREWQEELVGNMSSREFVPEISYAVVSSSLPQGERSMVILFLPRMCLPMQKLWRLLPITSCNNIFFDAFSWFAVYG
uniref:Uncharacterized protein n=4 Tax=Gossypium TaxID=3633 RepID=A0A0D2SKW7_GOSRA|nr:hypothetical protein B456_007G276700 [Gossypium raimondii]